MMSAQGGGTPETDGKLSKGGCVKMQTKGGGVKKCKTFADVICTWPLIRARTLSITLIHQFDRPSAPTATAVLVCSNSECLLLICIL